MALAEDGKFCGPCERRGLRRKAHRIMPAVKGVRPKTLMCEEDFRIDQGLPQLSPQAQAMVDGWTKKGMNINQIAAKHGTTWDTVNKYLLPSQAHRTAKKMKANRAIKSNGHANGNGSASVEVPIDLLDRVWNGLEPSKKAELLAHLS